jgi:hypothetical protein
MPEGARPSLGLSIGATNLAAVTAELAITRRPVLTLFRQRPPEVGVPSENPRLDEPGLVMAGFVDRVGDPSAIMAADGSVHRSEALATGGLRALAYTATGGRPLPEGVAVTYPAHWGPKATDALGSALSRVSEWSSHARPLTLISDAAATLFAVRANPGIPARGIVAVCDFGGSGTSITLVDAAGEYQPVAPTVRHHDFSGDLIDQALLTAVLDNVPTSGPFDQAGTSAIGSLTRLRAACRGAKEQLSSTTVTTLSDELPGLGGETRLTRSELDDAIRDPLDNFLAVLEETLARNRVRGSELVAVVSAGGGANIPAVTTKLSGRLRVPVVTAPRPHLTAAIGGALRASRGPDDPMPTKVTPAAPVTAVGPPAVPKPKKMAAPTEERPVLALVGAEAAGGRRSEARGYTAARPSLDFEQEARPAQEKQSPLLRWYRLPGVVLIGTAVAMLIVGIAVAISLDSDDEPATAPGVSSTPVAPAPTSAPPANGMATPPPQPRSQPQADDTTTPPTQVAAAAAGAKKAASSSPWAL